MSNQSAGYVSDDDPSERVSCLTCMDHRMVEVTPNDPTAAPTFKPCAVCNPIVHTRWANGCLRGSGTCTCAVCIGLRNGTYTAADFGPDGSMPVAV